MDDRIKLAEAMGWGKVSLRRFKNSDERRITGRHPDDPPHMWGPREIPDPFTDANDDYAVLEWMRSAIEASFYRDQQIQIFYDVLPVCCDYQTGDYARVALKVLE